jgi:hypothetical protein
MKRHIPPRSAPQARSQRTWRFDDGGRKAAGYKGKTADCVTRAISIATGLPYQQVYDELFARNRAYAAAHRGRVAERIARSGGATPRNGVFKAVSRLYLRDLGWIWHPTMQIGSGCKVHLRRDELPPGRLIVQVSKHLVAVIDGVIHDTHNCSRRGTRCVYGYWSVS